MMIGQKPVFRQPLPFTELAISVIEQKLIQSEMTVFFQDTVQGLSKKISEQDPLFERFKYEADKIIKLRKMILKVQKQSELEDITSTFLSSKKEILELEVLVKRKQSEFEKWFDELVDWAQSKDSQPANPQVTINNSVGSQVAAATKSSLSCYSYTVSCVHISSVAIQDKTFLARVNIPEEKKQIEHVETHVHEQNSMIEDKKKIKTSIKNNEKKSGSFSQILHLDSECHIEGINALLRLIDEIQMKVNLKQLTIKNFKNNKLIEGYIGSLKSTKALAFLKDADDEQVKDFLLHLVIAATHQDKIWTYLSHVGKTVKTDTINKIIQRIKGQFTVDSKRNLWMGEFKDGKLNGPGKLMCSDGRVFEGKFKDGKLNGPGKLTYPDGRVFEGEYKDDKANGPGKLTGPDGCVFEGEYKDGKPNGPGKLTHPDGRVFEGEYKDGKPNGPGKLTHPDGRVFEGEYKDDKANGPGKVTHPDGRVFEGEYKDDKANGPGKVTYPDGRVFEGEYKDDIVIGLQTLRYPNGNLYIGECKDDQPNGQGRQKQANGSIYEGKFENGWCIEGKLTCVNGDIHEGKFENGWCIEGKMTCLNGNIYEGKFKNGLCIQGKLTCANGNIYEGKFENGLCIQGKLTCANGNIYEGEFKNGLCIEGKLTCSNGNIYEGEFKNGLCIEGKLRYANGIICEGKFENGLCIEGKMICANGNIYKCEFKNGLCIQGKLTCANGDIYKGTWENGVCTKIWYVENSKDETEKVQYQREYVQSLRLNESLEKNEAGNIDEILGEFARQFGFNPNELTQGEQLNVFKAALTEQEWYGKAPEKVRDGIQFFIDEVAKKLDQVDSQATEAEKKRAEEEKRKRTTFMQLSISLFAQIIHYLNMDNEAIPLENKQNALGHFSGIYFACPESFPERIKEVLSTLLKKTKFSNPFASRRDELVESFALDFIQLRQRNGLQKLEGREIHYRTWIANLLAQELNFHSSYESSTDTYAFVNKENNEMYLNHPQDIRGFREPSTLTVDGVVQFFSTKINELYQSPTIQAEVERLNAILWPFKDKPSFEWSQAKLIGEQVFDQLSEDGVEELSGIREKYIVLIDPDDDYCETYKLNEEIFKDMPFLVGLRYVALGYYDEPNKK